MTATNERFGQTDLEGLTLTDQDGAVLVTEDEEGDPDEDES
jgi:hypothetical protein